MDIRRLAAIIYPLAEANARSLGKPFTSPRARLLKAHGFQCLKSLYFSSKASRTRWSEYRYLDHYIVIELSQLAGEMTQCGIFDREFCLRFYLLSHNVREALEMTQYRRQSCLHFDLQAHYQGYKYSLQALALMDYFSCNRLLDTITIIPSSTDQLARQNSLSTIRFCGNKKLDRRTLLLNYTHLSAYTEIPKCVSTSISGGLAAATCQTLLSAARITTKTNPASLEGRI